MGVSRMKLFCLHYWVDAESINQFKIHLNCFEKIIECKKCGKLKVVSIDYIPLNFNKE